MIRIKICGITNLADAKAATDAGANSLGFNFYEKSLRRISTADAAQIRSKLPQEIEAVGVFVNAKPADIKIPLQAHFANKDDWCTPELVNNFEKAMKAAGKQLELFRYDAEHAFVNEQRQAVHDRKAAELAWDRATGFFKKHLG